MDPDLRDILSLFNAHKLKYLVVGGYAVGVYSEPGATKDLDLFMKADPDDSQAIYRPSQSTALPF